MAENMRLREHNFITIQGWMVERLELSGAELIAFALIYGFSQDGSSRFTGSANYIAKWCGCSKRSVFNILKSLIDKRYITKYETEKNGVKFCDYAASNNITSEFFSSGYGKNFTGGDEKISPHNYRYISLEHKDSLLDGEISDTENRKRFTPPMLEEVRAYCKERHNNVDAEAFIAFYESNGWKVGKNPMKSWKAAVVTWEKSRSFEQGESKPKRREPEVNWV